MRVSLAHCAELPQAAVTFSLETNQHTGEVQGSDARLGAGIRRFSVFELGAGCQQAKIIGERDIWPDCVCMKRQSRSSCSPLTENDIRQESAHKHQSGDLRLSFRRRL
jgi:hypothetical protein